MCHAALYIITLWLLEASIFSPGLVEVLIPQDLDGHPRLPQEHVLGQVPVVPQIHSADTERTRTNGCNRKKKTKKTSQSQVALMCVPRHFITKTKHHSWAGRDTVTLLCCSHLHRLFKPKQWHSAKKHVKSKPHKPCMCIYLNVSLGSYPVSYQSLPWWTPKLFLNQKTMALHQQSDHTTFILFNSFFAISIWSLKNTLKWIKWGMKSMKTYLISSFSMSSSSTWKFDFFE